MFRNVKLVRLCCLLGIFGFLEVPTFAGTLELKEAALKTAVDSGESPDSLRGLEYGVFYERVKKFLNPLSNQEHIAASFEEIEHEAMLRL